MRIRTAPTYAAYLADRGNRNMHQTMEGPKPSLGWKFSGKWWLACMCAHGLRRPCVQWRCQRWRWRRRSAQVITSSNCRCRCRCCPFLRDLRTVLRAKPHVCLLTSPSRSRHTKLFFIRSATSSSGLSPAFSSALASAPASSSTQSALPLGRAWPTCSTSQLLPETIRLGECSGWRTLWRGTCCKQAPPAWRP